jgi:hypothetical protein
MAIAIAKVRGKKGTELSRRGRQTHPGKIRSKPVQVGAGAEAMNPSGALDEKGS